MTRALAACALACALAGTAHADERAELGFRIGMGTLAASGERVFTPSLGLAVEHRFAARWKLFGEYEWIWLYGSRAMSEERGDGQRAQVGVRHRLGEHAWHQLAMFADAEFGGGYMLANDNQTGVLAKPDTFVGARFGYELHSDGGHRSPSGAFEPELLLRGIATPDGLGMLFGVGALWQ